MRSTFSLSPAHLSGPHMGHFRVGLEEPWIINFLPRESSKVEAYVW